MKDNEETVCGRCAGRTYKHTPEPHRFPPGVVGLVVREDTERMVCDHCARDWRYLSRTDCWADLQNLATKKGTEWKTHEEFVELEIAVLGRYTAIGDPPQAALDEVAEFCSRMAEARSTLDDADSDDDDEWWDRDEEDEHLPYLSDELTYRSFWEFAWLPESGRAPKFGGPHVAVPYAYVVPRWSPDNNEVSISIDAGHYIRIAGAENIGPHAAMWFRLSSLTTPFQYALRRLNSPRPE